jgi:hypothetical protein
LKKVDVPDIGAKEFRLGTRSILAENQFFPNLPAKHQMKSMTATTPTARWCPPAQTIETFL